jgi:ADP-ribose pyrophosphatase YjhB (NUDIX family)
VVTAPPLLLDWARRLQALAQSGLAYDPDDYERERYEQVQRIAAEMLGGADAAELLLDFSRQIGYATPKLDVRGAVFRAEGDEILLVREAADEGRWTLPGGWADVGESPREAVEREVLEEAGWVVEARKLLALFDRDKHAHPPHQWHIWKVVFHCEVVGQRRPVLGSETTEADFFARDALPELSLGRVLPEQVERWFEHRDHPEWPADFD